MNINFIIYFKNQSARNANNPSSIDPISNEKIFRKFEIFIKILIWELKILTVHNY